MSVAAEYRELLVKFAPQSIRSPETYRRTLAQLEKLMVPHPSAARSRLIELLSTLVEDYESRQFPTPKMKPGQTLKHLLEARGVTSAEVAKSTGIGPATLSNVLAARRGISKQNAGKLAQYFAVSPLVFMDCGPE